MIRLCGWRQMLGGGLLLGGALTGCGGPGLTPLQAQYQQSEEQALRYHARGELPQALQAFQDSLRWAELADDRPAWVAQALNVGRVAQALGDEPLARQSFQQAQRTATALGDGAGRLRASLGLAQLALQRGQFEAAHTAFSRTLDAARHQQQDQPAALAALNGLGLAQIGLGRLPAARQTLAEAETLARSHRDPRLLASTLANQGGLAVRTSETDRAIRYLEEAVILDREMENLPGLGHDLALLAQVRQQRGERDRALELYRQAGAISRHTGQHDQAQRCDQAIERLEHESQVRLP